MKHAVLLFLLAGAGSQGFAQTPVTIIAEAPSQVYLIENTIDLSTADKTSGPYQYQPAEGVKKDGFKTFEEERWLGTTPVTVSLPTGPHEFRVVTSDGVVIVQVTADGKPQAWRVNVAPPLALHLIGWGVGGGLLGMVLLSGPAYIDSQRNKPGFGGIGFEISGGVLLTAILASTVVHTNAIREE